MLPPGPFAVADTSLVVEPSRTRPPSPTSLVLPLGIAILLALFAALGPRLLVLAAALGLPLVVVGYLRPAALFLLYFAALPLAGDQALPGGLRPTVVLTGVIAVFAATTLIRHRARAAAGLRQLDEVMMAFLALAVMGTVSAFVNYNSDIVSNIFEASFKPLVFAGLMLVVLVEFGTEARIRLLSWTFVLTSAAVACYALFTYVAGTAPTPVGDTPRLTGTFAEYNELGSYMLVTAMFTLGFAQIQSRHRERVILYAVFGIQVLALLLSLTLGSMFGLVTALGIYYLLRGGRTAGVLKYGIVLGILAIVVIAYLPAVADKIGLVQQRVMRRFATFAGGFQIIRENLLFGVGSKNVLSYLLTHPEAINTRFGATYSVPHNVFIVTFVQKGIFVFAALLGLLAAVWRAGARSFRLAADRGLRSFAAAVVGGMVGFLQQDLSNNMLLHPRIGLFFFIFLAVLIGVVDNVDGLGRGGARSPHSDLTPSGGALG